jgi:MurNAc alpha-1-phosphate uridylyltransferase
MQAMILAAGYGRRLRPLTDTIPKALVEVGGVTQLDRTIRALVSAGARRIIVNVHHRAEQIEEWLESRSFDADVLVSRELEAPLETGGGLLHARPLFDPGRPILVHNVDVITSIDLAALVEQHRPDAAATLAVHERPASRYLLFDDVGLQGRLRVDSGELEESRAPRGPVRRLAFSGVHVASGSIFDRINESGAFSIIDTYLRLAGSGQRVHGLDVTAARWLEIGTPERLAAARAALGS